MPRVDPIINVFNAGELSPLMEGRTDFAKYSHGCRSLQNFLPLIQGGILKRSGTKFVGYGRDPTKQCRLQPFSFNTEQTYMLEFGDTYIRIYRDGAIVSADANAPLGYQSLANGAGAQISATGATVTVGARFVFQGETGMIEMNNREFEATVVAGPLIDSKNWDGTALDSTNYGTANDDGTITHILEVDTPWDEDEVFQLVFAQSADVLYITHPNYAPRKLVRGTTDQSWTLSAVDFVWPPFEAENDQETKTVSWPATAEDGTITVTGVNTAFAATDVGRLFKVRVPPEEVAALWTDTLGGLDNASGTNSTYVYYEGNVYYKEDDADTTAGGNPPIHRVVDKTVSDGKIPWTYRHSGAGYGEISVHTSSLSIDVDVTGYFPKPTYRPTSDHESHNPIDPTMSWAFSAWDEVNMYPRCVVFHQDRLWFAGNAAAPNTFYGSVVGDFENHEVSDDDESALLFALNSNQINGIEWMMSGDNLILGTVRGEWSVSSSTGVRDAITPGNVLAVSNSTEGSREFVQPLEINDAVVFVQRQGRKINELVFESDPTDQYVANDLTRLAEHITAGKVKQMAWQQEPYRQLWAVTDDGNLISLTYERREDVIAWHRHIIGGTDVTVESIAVIPRADMEGDQLWMVVARTVDGSTERHIEYLEREWRTTDDLEDAKFSDSHLSYDDSAITKLNGLYHLRGETLRVLADGVVLDDLTVESNETAADLGTITLPSSASVITVGLNYNALVETMRLDAPSANTGTSQGKKTRIGSCVFRLHETGDGFEYGPDTDNLDTLEFEDASVLVSTDTCRLSWPTGGEDRGERVVVRHTKPLPCTLLAAMPQFEIEER